MSNSRLFKFALCIAFGSLSSAFAQAQPTMGGAGAASCGKILGDHIDSNPSVNLVVVAWVQGYLAATNVSRSHQHLALHYSPDAPTITAYVQKYCRDNPLQDLVHAADALSLESSLEVQK